MSAHSTHDTCAHCEHHHELRVDGLAVSYRKTRALENVSFSTLCGNALALVGPNGAGKSTLLKALAGLLRPDCGTILWRGAPIGRWSREIAYLPQRESVDWNFPITVRGVVEMGRYPQVGWWRGFKSKDDQAVQSALDAVEISSLQHRQIRELSGGQQQRVFLARALAQEAHALLLDEPFTGLDRPSQEALAATLRRLAAEGRLVIASHHDLKTVESIYDQVLLLRRKMIAFGTVANTFSKENIATTYREAGKEVA